MEPLANWLDYNIVTMPNGTPAIEIFDTSTGKTIAHRAIYSGDGLDLQHVARVAFANFLQDYNPDDKPGLPYAARSGIIAALAAMAWIAVYIAFA